MRTLLYGSVLSLTLVLTACGSATPADAGAGGTTPVQDSPGAGTDPDTATAPGSGTDTADAGAGELLADTVGDGPFYIDAAEVLIAESHPVQLFLQVEGNAPTPCHQVAYQVVADGAEIRVQVSTEAGDGMCAQVLEPHSLSIPLGAHELPVTVSVNDGDISIPVDG
ncbi:MAG: hypothetical protein Q4G67_09250 [Actinomycetia bacterium]|nr:hypothetical protein [Actinomycetes bacterium]